MCVAIPALVTAVGDDGRTGTARVADVERTVDLAMTPDAGVGDWVITHSGFAVRTITAEDAQEIHRLLASALDD
jgi:hydrogenase expression/formation protein HypC